MLKAERKSGLHDAVTHCWLTPISRPRFQPISWNFTFAAAHSVATLLSIGRTAIMTFGPFAGDFRRRSNRRIICLTVAVAMNLCAHSQGISTLPDSVIVSTGAQSLMLGLEPEERLLGHGLSTCATCDGFFFRGHEIAVVGGGDSAIEEATFLTKFASKVTLIHRRDSLRASKIMQDRALNNPKIEMLWNSTVVDLLGGDKLEGAVVRNVLTGAETTLAVTGLFVAIGHRPNTDLFKGVLDMEESGYLVTKPGSSYTNIDGVFACGDVQDHTYRQAITAAGSGCMAAIDAERWLEAHAGH